MSQAVQPAEPHLQRKARRRRRLKRALLALGAGVALATLLVLWGWRYGFTRLPEPLTEVRLPEVEVLGWDALPPGCAWEPVHRLAAHADIGTWWQQSEGLRELTAASWIDEGAVSQERVQTLSTWLAARPSVETAFDALLAAHRPPAVRGISESADRTLRLLGWVPLARAVVACPERGEAGRVEAALRHLITGLAWYARLTPPSDFAAVFDERGPREVDATLGRAFRRLVLYGPPLEPAAGRGLLEELRRVTNGVMPFEAAYALGVKRAREARDADRQALAADVRQALNWCVFSLRRDAVGVGTAVQRWFGGGGFEWPTTFKGPGHLRRPLQALAVWVQEAVAREADFERIWQARQGRMLGMAAGREASGFAARPPEWLRRLDRPAVWNSTWYLPRPDAVLEELGGFLATVEACRLTLALRLHRDRKGDWPDSLEHLTPDILTAVPVDPLTGGPFGYRREGSGWRLTAGRTEESDGRFEWTSGQ